MIKPINHRSLIVLSICAFCSLGFVVLWAMGFLPLQQMECFAQDWQTRLGRKTPLDDRFALIGIDKPVYSSEFSDEELQGEPVLRELKNDFPWSRLVWARLIEKLAEADAKVIILDLVFASPGPGDEELRAAIEKYRDRVVIGYNINIGETDRGVFNELVFPHPDILGTHGAGLPSDDGRLGYVNVWPDFDGTLRRLPYHLTGAQAGVVAYQDVVLESLAARSLRKYGRADAIPVDFNSTLFRFTSSPDPSTKPDQFKPHPIGEILSPKLWKSNYDDGKVFAGKIVLIGPTAAIFHDEHSTPFSDPKVMAGPEIHLQIINAALHGEFLSESSPAGKLWIIGFAGIFAAALCFVIRQPAKRLLGAVCLGGSYLLATQFLFDRVGWVLPLAVPLMVLMSISLIVFSYDFVLERLERMKIRNTMGLYFSPRVLDEVLSDPGSMEPRRADVTLLLTDLRNSTPLSEMLGPHGMFELLNKVFEAQIQAIMAEEGNLEHFLGDQFLSYWGAPQAQPDAADRASRAAICLIVAMEKLRVTLTPEVHKLFGYGVALHSGSVLVGNKGSAQRLDYGLVGDTVNEASRVEALTKYYGAKLLVTRATLSQFSTEKIHRLVDRVIVKGKSEPVELFECENPCTIEEYATICRRYTTAYDEYSTGAFAAAQRQFDLLVTEFSDGPSKALSMRCANLIDYPPTEWRGIWKMDAK